MITEHSTRLVRLDPEGLHWLLKCDACPWRVVIDDSSQDNDRNYVALSIEHQRTGSMAGAA